MKFYNRTSELAELQRIQRLSVKEGSRFTVVTGRRRIGKTSLIMKAAEGQPPVYLFVGRKNEATLCTEFIISLYGSGRYWLKKGVKPCVTKFWIILSVSGLIILTVIAP